MGSRKILLFWILLTLSLMAEPKHFKTRTKIIIGSGLLIVGFLLVALLPANLPLSQDITFKIIDGRKIHYNDLKGKPLLISFWATTCSICIKKTPELIALYEEFHPGKLEIIAVAMSYDPPNRILDFAQKNKIPYPISLDIDGEIAQSFDDVSVTPSLFLVDQQGKIVLATKGNIDIETIKKEISKLLSMQPKLVASLVS